jgi:hypothetical protein
MNNSEKAYLYDEYLRESDRLQRENSKIKSDFAGNIPPHLQDQIRKNTARIGVIVGKLEALFKN